MIKYFISDAELISAIRKENSNITAITFDAVPSGMRRKILQVDVYSTKKTRSYIVSEIEYCDLTEQDIEKYRLSAEVTYRSVREAIRKPVYHKRFDSFSF